MPSTPCLVFGTVKTGTNLKIKLTNTITGDEIITRTNRFGNYLIDAGNFTNGYTLGDKVELTFPYLPTHTENITINNGDLRLK